MSVYDTIGIGPLRMVAGMINADYVTIAITAEDGPKPYVEDGAIYLPVRAWEQAQQAITDGETYLEEAE